jgi:hypothetical protein
VASLNGDPLVGLVIAAARAAVKIALEKGLDVSGDQQPSS